MVPVPWFVEKRWLEEVPVAQRSRVDTMWQTKTVAFRFSLLAVSLSYLSCTHSRPASPEWPAECQAADKKFEAVVQGLQACTTPTDCRCVDTRAYMAPCWTPVAGGASIAGLLSELRDQCGLFKRGCAQFAAATCERNLCVCKEGQAPAGDTVSRRGSESSARPMRFSFFFKLLEQRRSEEGNW